MTQQEIQDRMEVCPWRERPTGNPYVCTRYCGTTVLCDGACSWVADYPKLKELKDRKVLCEGCEEECEYVSNIPPVFDEGYWERLGEDPVSDELEKVVEEIVDPTVLNAYGVKEIANRLRRTMIESVSEDLEQAIDTYLATYFGGEKEKQDWPFLKKMAIHFANWQKKKNDYAIEIARMAGEEEGKNIMKQQLMAKAVDGLVVCNNFTHGYKDILMEIPSYLNVDDEVKVIIIKED